jgi:uncharacterized membrane protein (UPF0127 family)
MKRWCVPLLFVFSLGACGAPVSPTTNSVELRGQHFSVELATNDAARERGLMARTVLAADHGMLFVFATSAPQAFWMKNTLIPLDILYFDDARKLVSVQHDVPPCTADPCPVYPSSDAARYVLELSAGTAQRIGVKPGDQLTINGSIGAVQ